MDKEPITVNGLEKLKVELVNLKEKKRSLNLATSVAIVLSENLRQTNYIWIK